MRKCTSVQFSRLLRDIKDENNHQQIQTMSTIEEEFELGKEVTLDDQGIAISKTKIINNVSQTMELEMETNATGTRRVHWNL